MSNRNWRSDCRTNTSDRRGRSDRTDEESGHVHEFQGSTQFAEEGDDRHNHRFAGISGEAIGHGRNHFHCIRTRTDTTNGHHHEICERSGPAIFVNNGSGWTHIHFVEGRTSRNDDHRHGFQFATLIENPTENDNR